MGSRFANRVYIEIVKKKIIDFDVLHDTLANVKWSDYLTGREMIVIEASSTRSALNSTPTIQSVAQKAIFSTLYTPNNANAIETHILILMVDDEMRVLLDVT
jgi:23S rRNA G2445 N2-methylase RlmL